VSGAFLVTTRPHRWRDLVAGVIAGGLAAWAGVRGVKFGAAGAMWPLLAANAWLAVWWSRGWLRRAVARRKSAT
jgi:hypothetical protein